MLSPFCIWQHADHRSRHEPAVVSALLRLPALLARGTLAMIRKGKVMGFWQDRCACLIAAVRARYAAPNDAPLE